MVIVKEFCVQGVILLVEMKDILIVFGGIKVVDYVSVDLYSGEVVGFLGYNGVGKFMLIKVFLGVYQMDSGEICINGDKVEIINFCDVCDYNIEMIYQMFVLVDNFDVVLNFFLGCELVMLLGLVDDQVMEVECCKIMGWFNLNFQKFSDLVLVLLGG